MAKIVYCYNEQKYFERDHSCQPSPLEANVYLAPSNSTETPPPTLKQNEHAKWDGNKWNVETHTGKYLIKSGITWDVIVLSKFPPLVDYLDCPVELDNIQDADIVENAVTFNPAKKAARLAAEESARQAEEAARQTELALRQAIKTRATQYKTQLTNANIDGISNLNDAKVLLNGLRNILVNLVDDIEKAFQRTL